MKHLLYIFLFISNIAFAQTGDCEEIGEISTQNAMNEYYGAYFCSMIETAKNDDGSFSDAKANQLIENLKAAIRANPAFAELNITFPQSNAEIITFLRSGNCSEAGKALASSQTGVVNVDTFNNEVLPTYRDILDETKPKNIEISTETTQPSCGLPNGSITITATAGTGPYSYSIDDGVTFTEGKTLFDRLIVGTYKIVVKDVDGNEGRKTVELEAAERYVTPASPVITAAMPNARVANTTANSFCIAYSPTNVSHCYTFKVGFVFERPLAGNNWTLKITKVPDRFSNDLIGNYLPLFNQDQPDRFLGFYKAGSHPPATCTELNAEGEIGGQCIGLLCKELLLPDDVFRNLKAPGLFMEDHLSGHYAPEVSELVEEIDEIITRMMNSGQYKELIHDKKAGTYTAEELQNLKQILLDYENASKLAYGEVDALNFGNLLKYFKCDGVADLCTKYPLDGEDNSPPRGIIPPCWWQFQYNGMAAFGAGIADGIAELLEMGVDLGKLNHCWLHPTSYFWDTDKSCATLRQNSMEAVKFTWELSSGNPIAIAEVLAVSALVGDKIWDDLGIWGNELGLCKKPASELCCLYTKGRFAFDIGSLLVGAGEFKVAGKISGLGSKMLAMTNKLVSRLNKIKFHGKVLTLKYIKNTGAAGTAHLMLMVSLNGEAAIQTGLPIIANEAKAVSSMLVTTTKVAEREAIALGRALEASAGPGGTGANLVGEMENIAIQLDGTVKNLEKLVAYNLNNNIIFGQQSSTGFEALFAFTSLTAGGTVLSRIPKDDTPTDCNYCLPAKNMPQRLCTKLQQLQTKGGTSGTAGVQKLCSSLGNTQLEAVAEELLLSKYSNVEVTAFMDDITGVLSNCNQNQIDGFLHANVGSLTVAKIEAWKIFYEASRPCLRKSEGHINKLVTAKNSSTLSIAPYSFTVDNLKNIARAGGSANTFAEKFDNTVYPNLVKFSAISAGYTNMDKLKAKLSQQNSGATLEGTNFIVKYMGDHPTEFNGGIYEFEAYENTWARYVDVEDRRSGDQGSYIYYEFKSVQESSFNATDFTTQFVKDLQNANTLSQIRWIFDHEKMDATAVKTKVLAALIANLPMLNNAKDNQTQKFANWFGLLNPDDDIDATDIDNFINTNFNLIFK